jgi:hypothetical protein
MVKEYHPRDAKTSISSAEAQPIREPGPLHGHLNLFVLTERPNNWLSCVGN